MRMERSRDTILALLATHRDALRERGAVSLALFGSAARGEAGPSSDLDFLVELSPKTFDSYMDVKFYLEDLFHGPVDLVVRDALKPFLRERILSEAVHAEGL